jgi:hypothetical protein
VAGGGLRLPGWWVWCGSVARGDDGRYHCFASRWPADLPFFHGYLAASEVIRAVSDRPEGPYAFAEVVLPPRGPGHWDGRMTHNPFILRHRDRWLLFYIGCTWDGPMPTCEEMHALRALNDGPNGRIFPWYRSIRIGMAQASSLCGPWIRPEHPTFDVDPAGWDANVVTNPSPCVAPDGRILLYYRAGAAKLGLAIAEHPDAAFIRHGAGPIIDPGDGRRIEDPFVWHDGERYQMVCKDLTGDITGEYHAAAHLWSPDGMSWHLADPAKAWSRTVAWNDGSTTTQASIERPFILMDESGRPGWLFAATADGPGPRDGRPGHYWAHQSWNMVIPLASPS